MFISAIPGIFAECTAIHYRIFKIINLMKGGSRRKGPGKIHCHCQVQLPFSDMPLDVVDRLNLLDS